MNKLVVVIMGQNCEKFIGMCLESVKDVDAIVYCDGGSTDNTLNIVKETLGKYVIYDKEDYWSESVSECEECGIKDVMGIELMKNKNVEDTVHLCTDCFGWEFNGLNRVIYNKYNQNDPAMNGKQRNFYLDHIKKQYPDYWCLVLDADEVVEDLSVIKSEIQHIPPGVYSVKMRHFHNDLGHEDATVETHFVLNRLFKIECADRYPEVEHPVLIPKQPGSQLGRTSCTTIWHLAHINHCFNIKGRYEKNIKHSNIHTPQFLEDWKDAHIFGTYPSKPVNPTEIPEVILKNFHVDKDKLYFANRGVELKHPLMVKQWNDYFKPNSILDLGCGRGPYLYFWRWFVETYAGIELSKWATQNSFCDHIINGDITTSYQMGGYDLVTAIDVLEHLDNEQLDKAMKNIVSYGKNFLFSVPVIGDPNLENDKTHKQFRTREDWIKLLESYGIQILPTPQTWMFSQQLFIGKKI